MNRVECHYTDLDGVEHIKYFATEDEAMQWLREHRLAINSGMVLT